MKTGAWVALGGFVGVIVAANGLTASFGLVTVAGLTATAGTWVAGLGFVARDWLHETGGPRWVAAAIALGTALSVALSPAIAVASGVAFLVSESADWAVYTPLRRRSILAAALLSNTVGAVVDSALFLVIAGFPLAGLWAQVAVKVAATTCIVLILIGARRALLRQPMHAASGGRHA